MMPPRVLHDDGGSQTLTEARRHQQGSDSSDSCTSMGLKRSSDDHKSHEQGAKTSPTATMACTWGSGSPLLDTLAHCYTPHCTPGPSPYIYKRKVQGSRTRRWPRGRTGRRTRLSLSLSLSPTRTLVTPYCKRISPRRRTTRRSRFPLTVPPPLCSVSRRPIWTRTRSDNLLVGPGTPRGRNADSTVRRAIFVECDTRQSICRVFFRLCRQSDQFR
jgi:hypothetical protein